MGRTGNRLELTGEERARLEKFALSGERPALIIRRALIVLALDTSEGREAPTQDAVAERFGVTRAAVANIKHDFLGRGLDGFLGRKRREAPPVPAKGGGGYEAHLIALGCTEPPEGYSRWTVRLLAGKSVELGYIDSISYSTVSRILKKTSSSPT
jgi:hypothetical protein